MSNEAEFEWAKRYLEDCGYKIVDILATSTLSVLRLDEHGEIANDAILREDGDVLLQFQVVSPAGLRKTLRPYEIIDLAKSKKRQEEAE